MSSNTTNANASTVKFNTRYNDSKYNFSRYSYGSTSKTKEVEKKLDESDFPSLKPPSLNPTENSTLINEAYTKKNTSILNFLAAAKKVPEEEPQQTQADEIDTISLNDDVFKRHSDEEESD
jgi:hypothetical protein